MATNKQSQSTHSDTYQGQETEPHEIKDEYNFHDASFRRHYQLNYSDNERDYEEFYAPAYRYGYELAQKQSGDNWESVQEEARSHWQTHHSSSWSDVAEAVQYGWREQRNPEELRVHHHNSYQDMQPSFESHFAESFAGSGATFETFSLAYNYGYMLAVDPEHRTRLWDDMEPTVREYWKEEYDEHLPWEHYRDAARHAWHTMRASTPSA